MIKRDLLTPLFVQAEVYVMYHGDNNNRSSISKEVIEKNIHTMKNIPIVGKYDYDAKNFKSHEMTIGISEDGDIKFVRDTVPLGIVPETFRWRWETVVDDYGLTKEYLVVENAYIWNRDIDLTNDLMNNVYGHSMEIMVTDSYMRPDNIKQITEFYFEALCILGIDKDGHGGITPAFENAKIQVFDENETYNDKLNKMLRDFEKFTKNEGGLQLKRTDLEKEVEKDKLAMDNFEKEQEEEKEVEEANVVDENSTHEEVITDEADKVEEVNERETIVDIPESFDDEVEEKEEVDTETTETETETETKEDEKEDVPSEEVVENTDEDNNEGVEVDNTEDDTLPQTETISVELHNAKVKELEDEIKHLKEENDALNFEKHERLCNDVVSSFKTRYDLDDASLATLNFSEIKDVKELESKLYEIIGRNVQFNKSDKSKEVGTKIYSLDLHDESPKFGFEKLFKRTN